MIQSAEVAVGMQAWVARMETLAAVVAGMVVAGMAAVLMPVAAMEAAGRMAAAMAAGIANANESIRYSSPAASRWPCRNIPRPVVNYYRAHRLTPARTGV